MYIGGLRDWVCKGGGGALDGWLQWGQARGRDEVLSTKFPLFFCHVQYYVIG